MVLENHIMFFFQWYLRNTFVLLKNHMKKIHKMLISRSTEKDKESSTWCGTFLYSIHFSARLLSSDSSDQLNSFMDAVYVVCLDLLAFLLVISEHQHSQVRLWWPTYLKYSPNTVKTHFNHEVKQSWHKFPLCIMVLFRRDTSKARWCLDYCINPFPNIWYYCI